MKPERVLATLEQEKEHIPAAGAKRRPRKHIAIVERDAALADLLREALWQETPCHICRLTTGEQALRLVPQLRPDLLIVGFHLADMTGMEVYEQLHASKELVSLPTILLGTSQPGVRTGPALSICLDQAFGVASLLQTITALLGEDMGTASFHGYAARQ
ncbi:MAG TPA: response regulator [Ktedonobacteraceae bacterium]